MSEREPVAWITRGGKHIPIFVDEPSDDEKKKDREISANEAEADERTNNFTEFSDNPNPWFRDNSNFSEWDLSTDEYEAVRNYTGSDYGFINNTLYNTKSEDVDEQTKETIQNIENALSRFELYEGVTVTRQCDFSIFGKDSGKMSIDDIKGFLSGTKGVVQNDAFMSFSADKYGKQSTGRSGIVIHLNIPPSKGAGAWIAYYSTHPKEKEFLLNNKSVLRFNTNTMRTDEHGNIHITANWLGQASIRTVDKKGK